MAAAAAAGLFPAGSPAASPFPVKYARSSPYDELLRYVEPGTDEFEGEKAAAELEARLSKQFGARCSALPDAQVRFEKANPNEYRTGVWQLPDLKVVREDIARAEKPYFRDVTSHVFGGAASFRDQLLKGNPYWRTHLDSATGIDTDGNQGIAVGDIDNDGVDEIYVCQSGGLPNRLYRLRADGTAEDITERAGVGILDETTCALFVDFRNSGLQDLVVLRRFGPSLFLNQGNGTFRELPNAFHFRRPAQGVFTGMAAADYDCDGRVDLYLCTYVYVQGEEQYQYPAPYHDAQNGPPNFLFHNRLTKDGGVFEDVTEESGINENNNRFSFAPAWCDYDGDGWPDLYVANDFGRNSLYRNRAGKFRDEAAQAGVEDIGAGMSASWFDSTGDGKPDLYVSNMWSAAGQRVVRDPAFRPAAGNATAYQRHAKGNTLYRNAGNGRFEETGEAEMGRWAWGSGGFDFDLDGVPEIFSTSGMVSNGAPAGSADLDSFFWRQVVANSPETLTVVPEYENAWNAIGQMFRGSHDWRGGEPNVFYKKQGGRYVDHSGVSGLDFADDSRAFAVTDFDGDGCPDLILKSRRGPQVRAMQNDCAGGKAAISVALKGTRSNRDAIGAKVEVNGQVQWLSAGGGFLSQHSKRLHFGLAGRERAEVKITWPSGLVQSQGGLEAGYGYTITEGQATPMRAAFRERKGWRDTPVAGENSTDFGDTWLLEPVPTPQKEKGPGFITLRAEDLAKQPDDVAATWSLFHRYLFEYRAELSLPLTMLIDGQSRARKIYANPPSAARMKADLAGGVAALPFPGRYMVPPRRNYFKLGVAFYWAGYSDRALPYLKEELRHRPDNWNVLLALGRIQQELGQLDDALSTFRRVQAARPGYAPAIVNEGMVLLRKEEPTAAKATFLRAMEADGKSAEAANELGLMAAQANERTEARNWFHKAIEAVPGHAEAVNNLGVFYAQIRQFPDAIAALRYGLQFNPANESLHLNLARVLVMMGQRDEARAVLTQLLERRPDSKLGRKLLNELE
jgi:Flp pilus assembly protein TadD